MRYITGEIRGFRAPQLAFNDETLQSVRNQGLLYDSSIVTWDHGNSNYGSTPYWPFTMEQPVPTDIGCTFCQPDTSIPGLWEIPLWRLYDAVNNALAPTNFAGNITEVLDLNLERRYNGNRAPLGINMGAGWLQENNFNLKRWIESVMVRYDDVHFITMSELIAWMRSPIPKRQYRTTCQGQGECFTPIPINCIFGDFDTEACECRCNPGYCLDAAGLCTRTSGCGDIDGGWGAWDRSRPCCEQTRLLTRMCNNPAPAGNGADCIGSAYEMESCSPDSCPNDGWTAWSDWGECCEGNRSRTRECLASPSINNGQGCAGNSTEIESCAPSVCRRAWYPEYSLGGCINSAFPPPGTDLSMSSFVFEDCCNEHFSFNLGTCYQVSQNPPVHGGWGDWSPAGPCCGGYRVLWRNCDNPAPLNRGRPCEGSATIQEACTDDDCINGGWSEWTEFSECCDRRQTRRRECLAPPGVVCEGESTESQFCPVDTCEKLFTPNFNRGLCVRVQQSLDVTNGLTSNGATYKTMEECCQANFEWNFAACTATASIPVDGGWTDWSDWGPCCLGSKTRFRACTEPRPSGGGLPCDGTTFETVPCTDNDCPLGPGSMAFRNRSWLSIGIALLVLPVVAGIGLEQHKIN